METKALVYITSDTLLESAKAFIAKGQITKWSQDTHLTFLCKIIVSVKEMDGIESRAEEYAATKLTLAQHGLGGNASQFRQWLECLVYHH